MLNAPKFNFYAFFSVDYLFYWIFFTIWTRVDVCLFFAPSEYFLFHNLLMEKSNQWVIFMYLRSQTMCVSATFSIEAILIKKIRNNTEVRTLRKFPISFRCGEFRLFFGCSCVFYFFFFCFLLFDNVHICHLTWGLMTKPFFCYHPSWLFVKTHHHTLTTRMNIAKFTAFHIVKCFFVRSLFLIPKNLFNGIIFDLPDDGCESYTFALFNKAIRFHFEGPYHFNQFHLRLCDSLSFFFNRSSQSNRK